jgi:tetratricopeptide (TPR) repeat protein
MDMSSSDILEAVKGWPSKQSLLLFLVIEAVFSKLILPSEGYFFALGLFILWVPTVIVWILSRKIPKKRKNLFGFVVAIYCDDNSIENKFREDFIKTLRKQLKSRPNATSYDFIPLPKHISESIEDSEQAIKILKECNGDFIIHGSVRTRDKNHILDVSCAAIHAPISEKTSQEFSREMGELLVNKIKIEDSQFLEGFDITTQYIETAANYLIGNMKFFAGDFNSALEIYKNVLDKLLAHNRGALAENLKIKCQNNIAVVLDILLFSSHKAWVDSHDEAFIDEMETIFTDCDRYNLDSLNFDRYKAIHSVLKKKDFKSARRLLNKTPQKLRDGLWHLNTAFIFACEGNLQKSAREYRNALDRPNEVFGNNLIADVEGFISYYLEKYPDLTQLHYCLGFINKELKQDFSLAKQHLEDFLNSTPSNIFETERNLAQKWLLEICV